MVAVLSACGGEGDTAIDAIALDLELHFPSEIRQGETAPLTLTIGNTADRSVQFLIGGSNQSNYLGGYDFIVKNEDGDEVWIWPPDGTVYQSILSSVTLQPGEKLEFERDWPAVDRDGRPVAPAIYGVEAVLKGETAGGEAFEFRTPPLSLVISP